MRHILLQAILLAVLSCLAAAEQNRGNCPSELLAGPTWQSPLQGYMSSDFNVISFGNFNASTGDVEGRLAVLGNCNLGDGFSIGYQLQTSGANATDRALPYAFAVGGNLKWVDGDLYPDGSNNPYPGTEEGMYVGGTVSAPSFLSDRRTGGPCSGNCLKPSFSAAYQYFLNVSSLYSKGTPNAEASLTNDGLFVTTSDARADRYYIQLDTDTFNNATYWSATGVNIAAQFIITLTGNSDVYFTGGDFPGITERIVYNIPGKRTVYVKDNAAGNLLAPQATLVQYGGDEKGFVIVADVLKFVEAQKPVCPSEYCCKWCTNNNTNGSSMFF